MIDQTLNAHTHSDRTENEPRTVARVVRHATAGLTVALVVLALIGLGLGLTHDTLEAFIIGCTVLVCSSITGSMILTTYIGELIMRGHCAIREESAEDHQEIRERLKSLEAGERVIADSVQQLGHDAAAPDELGQRRGG